MWEETSEKEGKKRERDLGGLEQKDKKSRKLTQNTIDVYVNKDVMDGRESSDSVGSQSEDAGKKKEVSGKEITR